MTQTTNQSVMKVVEFQLKEKEYAIPIQQVRGIEKILHITRVPKVADYLKGVINLRGEVIPVMSIRLKMELEEEEYTKNTAQSAK